MLLLREINLTILYCVTPFEFQSFCASFFDETSWTADLEFAKEIVVIWTYYIVSWFQFLRVAQLFCEFIKNFPNFLLLEFNILNIFWRFYYASISAAYQYSQLRSNILTYFSQCIAPRSYEKITKSYWNRKEINTENRF